MVVQQIIQVWTALDMAHASLQTLHASAMNFTQVKHAIFICVQMIAPLI